MINAGTSKNTAFVCLVTIFFEMQSLVKNKLFDQRFVCGIPAKSQEKMLDVHHANVVLLF